MNTWDIIISAILVIAVVLAIAMCKKKRKKGGCFAEIAANAPVLAVPKITTANIKPALYFV